MIWPIDRLQVKSLQKGSTKAPVISKVDKISASAKIKDDMNIDLMESEGIELETKDHSLSLLFNVSIDKINEQFSPEFGDLMIQKSHEDGLDKGPEKTAERIVNLTTHVYQAFQTKYQNEAKEVVIEKFIKTVSLGIEQGFSETRSILIGLAVLDGGIAKNIDKTYDLIQEKLLAFKHLILDQYQPSDE